MNKAVRKFAFSAEFAVFILLAVLLSVINIVDFAMASDDADFITHKIADGQGKLGRDANAPAAQQFEQNAPNNRFAPGFRLRSSFENMGPESPEMDQSLRYFTYAFDKNGSSRKIVFKMSAVSEEEAEQWAKSLLNGGST